MTKWKIFAILCIFADCGLPARTYRSVRAGRLILQELFKNCRQSQVPDAKSLLILRTCRHQEDHQEYY